MRKIIFLSTAALALFAVSCKKSSEELQTAPISDYYPLEVGKYITYSLDSTVFTNFGQNLEVHSYQVKHSVDAQITDNLGRPAYRITRFIRSSPTAPWVSDNTFMAVPTGSSMEFVENNLRFLKMKSPIRDGFTWKGNTYIDTYSSGSNFKFMADWDYSYDSLNLPAKIGTLTIDSTITVRQQDEVHGDPNVPGTLYADKTYSLEKYAKGIGLIYQNFIHWEYQNIIGGRKFYVGYGVKLSMIDHN